MASRGSLLPAATGVLAGVIIVGCGETPTDPKNDLEPQVQLTIDGPGSHTLTAIGATLQLTATVTSSDGTPPGVSWFSTNPVVADVERLTGLVLALANGTARIWGRAGDARDTVEVTVEQAPAKLVMFPDPPPKTAAGIMSAVTLQVAVTDANQYLVYKANDSVTIFLGTNPGGGILTGTTSVEADAGIATFSGLSIDKAANGYTFMATATFDTIESLPFDVLSAPDIVRFHNTADYEVGAVLDGANSGFVNDLTLVSGDSTVSFVFEASGVSDEAVGFTQGRPPEIVTQIPWTTGPDTIDVTFRDPIRIPVTAWIVAEPFAALEARAISQSITTTSVWDNERMGVEFEEFEIVDATQDPDAPQILNTTQCQQQATAETLIGKRSGRVNIYYVNTVDGGRGRGYSCSSGDVIFMADQSGDELLVHEIGHSFGLGHIDGLASYGPTNVMHSASSVRQYLTEGQVFRSHFDTFTALNQIYGVVPPIVRFCPDFLVNSGCPELGLRLWADGFIPPSVP